MSPAAFRTKAPATDGRRSRSISPESLNEKFAKIGEKLRNGLSSEAETLLKEVIENYTHEPDNLANLKRLQSFTFETLGQYKPALEALRPFEDEENLKRLNIETQVRVSTQLAISYNNLGDHPRAVTLLKETLKKAADHELNHLSGGIDIGLARVYRKLNECPIGRGFAEKALDHFREQGSWLGMAEAYREIALSYHQEGNSARSIEFFDLGIQIIGDNSAPFMLGKLYTDMSGAYWFLRRPKEGVECLEKSIKFFDQTEHVLNSVIAYNNLGLNLIIIGDLVRAEKMIRRALDLAVKSKHSHVAGILDSLSEIKIMRGELDAAEEYLVEAVSVARERNREWYEAQALRNLARVYLGKGQAEKAIATARETIELSGRIGEKHYANMAGLVLAESLLEISSIQEAENYLKVVEESDQNADFYVLGSIQRIRGVAALKNDDVEMALHHFNRSLTIFEAAGDVFHTGYLHLLIGSHTPAENRVRAVRHLTTAGEIFKKLDIPKYADETAKKLASLQTKAALKTDNARGAEGRRNSVVSQLLMVRLAEASASHELLFRELMAVLQQESRAKRIIIAEQDESKRYVPFITHGYSPEDTTALIAKFNESVDKGDERSFARIKNVAVFDLRSTAAPPAVLMIQPQSGAVLLDESSLQPLLRVVELGMDVVALREKDKSLPVELETSPYTSNSLMPGFIHSSPAMTDLVEEVYKIRSSDVTVLVTGESGTGKELVSRAIHTISNAKGQDLCPLQLHGRAQRTR